ncbi:hypothetical protein C5B89_10905 [Haloferax sp. Atlit-47N]|uniref:Uncharacterized protein n=1 Tax=Haloferax volcanii TaxID=2246 RepID=A0A847TX28_HALVO|nr:MULTISPECIES: hypothetical protein [Haloferax]MBC9986741.1 hypothetical protein [Haloferax sp. AS1]NLV03588.1 hypothetical protein [Haloferax alexandrinus]RDZ39042.1 hypothetical protein C5B89_10905 [Haloferax sp. Atlit-47N]
MTRDPLLTVEMKTTLAFMFLGLTSWYLAQRYLNDGFVELVALFGVGVVLPTLINELRQRSRTE